jgi:hypothetical protein
MSAFKVLERVRSEKKIDTHCREKKCVEIKTPNAKKKESDEKNYSRVGLDPGLHYLFIAKNNSNAEDKKFFSQDQFQGVLP